MTKTKNEPEMPTKPQPEMNTKVTAHDELMDAAIQIGAALIQKHGVLIKTERDAEPFAASAVMYAQALIAKVRAGRILLEH
jgi:hypothetical protein